MGASCAKFCLPHLSDPRTPPPDNRSTKSIHMVPCSVERRLTRLESVRNSVEASSVIFREGFALGMKVRKLQALFETLEAADKGWSQARPTPVVAEDSECKDFPADEPVVSVPPDPRTPVKIKDDHLQSARKLVPHSLHDLITKDFKPWLNVSLPGCPGLRL